MKDAVPVSTQHIALSSHLARLRQWAAAGPWCSERALGCWPAPCLPLPPLQLPSAARSGTGANCTSASLKGFLGARSHLRSTVGKGQRGVCEASLCTKAHSTLRSSTGHISLSVWRSPELLPGACPPLGRQWSCTCLLGAGGVGLGTGWLETHLTCEAGVNTWMLAGRLGLGLLGPQWLGHS